ncbi:DUF2947 family protein [Persicirhabdus sediminis]|uniref:DUF2947 family protein n=1 Tax=Persicirhabdus sediminis TaxID=454144 RepID=A0A8J7MCJ7_9BACT|nr:DUF2947 family protein [Persicirhabdus sediminis]MBK1789982.1 DUF2947 family protein [Persicirhabdus sediminis]
MIPNIDALESFELIWRFSDAEKYTQLTAEEFLHFQPLEIERSKGLWEQHVYSNSTCTSNHLCKLIIGNHIDLPDFSFQSFADDNVAEVIKELHQRISCDRSLKIYFFWHSEVCVASNWGIFLDHWDDFCYPSDDSNIIIFPDLDLAVLYREDMWWIMEHPKNSVLFDQNLKNRNA